MRIHLHEQVPGQSARCLEGLVRAAEDLARTPRMQRSDSVASVVQWIRAQPYIPDNGSAGPDDGCRPRQRTRFWPSRGLNCWEAVVHYTAAVLVHELPPGQELHIYDVQADGETKLIGRRLLRPGRRHVLPVIVHLPVVLHAPTGDLEPADEVVVVEDAPTGDIYSPGPGAREEVVELDSLVTRRIARPTFLRGAPQFQSRTVYANALMTPDGSRPLTEEELDRGRESVMKPPGEPLSPEDVANLKWYGRLYEGLVRGMAELPADLRKRLLSLFSTNTLWGLLLLVGGWVAGHALGLSEIADLGLTVYGAYVGGKAIWEVGGHFYHYGEAAIYAKTEGDLNVAGQHFAAAMSEGLVTSLEVLVASGVFRAARAAMLKVRPVPRAMKSPLGRVAERVAGRINARIRGAPIERPGEDLQSRERPEDLQSRERPEDTASRERAERERQDRARAERERAERDRKDRERRDTAAGLGIIEGGRKIGGLGLPLLLLAVVGLLVVGRPGPRQGSP